MKTYYVHRTVEKREIPVGDGFSRKKRRRIVRPRTTGHFYAMNEWCGETPDEGWTLEGQIPIRSGDLIDIHIWQHNGRITMLYENSGVFTVITGYFFEQTFIQRSQRDYLDKLRAVKQFNLKVAFGEGYFDIYLTEKPYRNVRVKGEETKEHDR